MPAISAAIAAIGLGASLFGTYEGVKGAQKQDAAEEALVQQQQQQMQLDASRQRRNIARQAVYQRSAALSNATNSGAGFGASSGVQGGQAAITAQQGVASLGLNQNTTIANNMFGLQQQAYQGASMASMGQGISSFGGMLMNNSQMIGKIGGYFTGGGWGGTSYA